LQKELLIISIYTIQKTHTLANSSPTNFKFQTHNYPFNLFHKHLSKHNLIAKKLTNKALIKL